MQRRRAAPATSRKARALIASVVFALGALAAAPIVAEEADVPAGVQARLVSKIPAYDRGFRQRAGNQVSVLILADAKSAESMRAAALMHAALRVEQSIAGLPQSSFVYPFSDFSSLIAEVKKRGVSVVYLTPGLQAWLEPICKALEPLNVLTIAPLPDYVQRCVIVGFKILGGKPKILIHLDHAQRSGIHFRSELLELAQVYR